MSDPNDDSIPVLREVLVQGGDTFRLLQQEFLLFLLRHLEVLLAMFRLTVMGKLFF